MRSWGRLPSGKRSLLSAAWIEERDSTTFRHRFAGSHLESKSIASDKEFNWPDAKRWKPRNVERGENDKNPFGLIFMSCPQAEKSCALNMKLCSAKLPMWISEKARP